MMTSCMVCRSDQLNCLVQEITFCQVYERQPFFLTEREHNSLAINKSKNLWTAP